VKTHALIVVLY